MQSIDFLITLSLLSNQATANALVITIQHAGWGSEGKTSTSVLKGIHHSTNHTQQICVSVSLFHLDPVCPTSKSSP